MAKSQIVRAPSDGWLSGVFVKPDDKVEPGMPLFSFMGMKDGGCTEEVKAVRHGIVKPFAEVSLFAADDYWQDGGCAADDYLGECDVPPVFVRKGKALFVIMPHYEGWDAGTIKGLTPRPTTVMYRRKMRELFAALAA